MSHDTERWWPDGRDRRATNLTLRGVQMEGIEGHGPDTERRSPKGRAGRDRRATDLTQTGGALYRCKMIEGPLT